MMSTDPEVKKLKNMPSGKGVFEPWDTRKVGKHGGVKRRKVAPTRTTFSGIPFTC